MIERTVGWYYKVSVDLAFGLSQKGTEETYADAGWCSVRANINLFTTKEDAVATYRRRCRNERSFCKQGAKLVRVVRKCPQPKVGMVFECRKDKEWCRAVVRHVATVRPILVSAADLGPGTSCFCLADWKKCWSRGDLRILSVPREV